MPLWHKWVKPLSLASLAVGAEGLMIETHPDPRNAAVDPLQAINFDEFSSLIDELREVGKVLNKENCIMTKDLVSIIVRTKNEGFWIGKCLKAIESQSYKNYEVIVVDDKSSDNTIKILKKHFPKVKLVKYKDKKFFPGKSLNLGISKSKGKYIVMISGHCIPKNDKWLLNFVKNIKNKNVAGCYGKQEPLDISNPNDVRDMYYLFGKDKKDTNQRSFFHNANSIIKKKLWKKFKFDEKTNHIEDRLWAQEVLNKKYRIVYEPQACVYHFHGVSHSNNLKRVEKNH